MVTADDVIEMLYTPRTLIRFFTLWAVIVVGGVFAVLVITAPEVFFSRTTNTNTATAPQWFVAFEQAQRTQHDARIFLDEQARTERAGKTTIHTQLSSAQASFPIVFPERISIPAIGTDVPISNPTSTQTDILDAELEHAVVRYPGSGTVEDPTTNMLIFGHSSYLPVVRNDFYKAFNAIQDLQHGDEIRIEARGRIYVYQVFRVYSASAQDDTILLNTGKHQLTLLTCDSFGKKSDRFIVEAEFVRSF